MKDILISKSRIKAFIRQSQMRLSKNFLPAVNEELKFLLNRSMKRAKANRRSTLLPDDL